MPLAAWTPMSRSRPGRDLVDPGTTTLLDRLLDASMAPLPAVVHTQTMSMARCRGSIEGVELTLRLEFLAHRVSVLQRYRFSDRGPAGTPRARRAIVFDIWAADVVAQLLEAGSGLGKHLPARIGLIERDDGVVLVMRRPCSTEPQAASNGRQRASWSRRLQSCFDQTVRLSASALGDGQF